MSQRAAFLSCEGVLAEDASRVSRPQEFHWLPGAVQALKWLQRAEWKLVVVTNQPGIARGLVGPAEYDNLTDWMRAELSAHGVTLAGIYHCPHLPDTPLAAWRRQCECHLPKPGLLRRAARDLSLDLPSCVMLGHRADDILAGRAARLAACVRILGDDTPAVTEVPTEKALPTDTQAWPETDYTCSTLAEGAYWLLAHERERRA